MRSRRSPVEGRRPRRLVSASDCGASLAELLIVIVVVSVLTAVTVPVTGAALDAERARQAASFLSTRVRAARQQAITGSAGAALVFDRVGGRWVFRLCVDGNANGVRRAELDGLDRCVGDVQDVEQLFPGVHVAVDSTIPGPDGDAPTSDPVKFGRSDMASCSPLGSCTAGTVFLRSERGLQWAIRVAGVTGRTRILRYDNGARAWRDG
jgi:type II secretory pathway pseudopilin PulG